MAEHPKWMDVDLPRPEGLAAGVPWPSKIRFYPPDHPARRDEESKAAFNWDWAVEDFGQEFLNQLIARQENSKSPFNGDWWLLALLRRCEQVAHARDPKGESKERFAEWRHVSNKLINEGVQIHLERAVLQDAHLEHAYLGGAWLLGANLKGANLEYANLSRVHLEHADLFGARLENANLLDAHLKHADLRSAHLKHADLSWAHLEDTNLFAADLNHANLLGAHLEYAHLLEAHLEHANLYVAHLEHAYLVWAHLEHATLFEAHLEHATLFEAHLKHADLSLAHLEHAKLLGAHVEHACLIGAVFTGADVRKATGLRFDANRVRDLHIEGNAPDPWSVLRRGYTGPLFFVHAALLVAFILPYVAKVLALSGADHAFPLKDGTRATISTSAGVWDVVVGPNPPAWRVLVGLEQGWWVPVIGAILLIYNAIRAVLTIKVGQLRDAEERSGITPTLEEYMGTQGLEDESGWRALWNVIRESWRWLAAAGVALAAGGVAMHYGLRWFEKPIGAPLASLVMVFGGAVATWVTWLVMSRIFQRKRDLVDIEHRDRLPTLIDVQPVGLWRLHRLLKALLVIALTSFAVHAVHWVWTTTLPRITVTPTGQAIEPAPSPAPASPPVATPPAEPPVLPMESATP